MPGCYLSLASLQAGAPCGGSLFKAEGVIRLFLAHSSQPTPALLKPAGTRTLSEQQHSVRSTTCAQGLHFRISEWTHTHTHTATLPPGSLAGDQRCKAMFWLGSATCSQGSPSHGRRGRVKLLAAFSFSLSLLTFTSFLLHYPSLTD